MADKPTEDVKMISSGTVGTLRQQSALQASDTPIQIVTHNKSLAPFLQHLKVIRVYPDMINKTGNWMETLKIEVDLD